MATRTKASRPPESMTSDIAWLNSNIVSKQSAVATIVAAEPVTYANAGGLSAQMSKVTVSYSNGVSETYVLKVIRKESEKQSKELGQPRESLFYESYATILQSFGIGLPEVVYSFGDMETGEKTILLEDLSDCIQCGYFYGPGSPLNWSKDLPSIIQSAIEVGGLSDLELRKKITSQAFAEAAKLHAHYWQDESAIAYGWLRGSKWITCDMEESWQAAQQTCLNYWANVQAKIQSNESTVRWDPFLVACCEASYKKISWSAYCEGIKSNSRSWTIVHGDFHPANMMWKSATSQLYILDWEMVGIGNGPQEIAQYLISHADPAYRREHEDSFIQGYYDVLIAGGKVSSVDFTKEQCYAEYVSGGVARWVWFLPLLANICPAAMTQYFHDQLLAFIIDHHVTPETIEMPRV